ncbi:MAG TPA: hypothetical protein VFS05_08655 [Gemmatimonadaceae bacterium]|nr:hypothetical protein [Gemmatimonadaceae bacterium]
MRLPIALLTIAAIAIADRSLVAASSSGASRQTRRHCLDPRDSAGVEFLDALRELGSASDDAELRDSLGLVATQPDSIWAITDDSLCARAMTAVDAHVAVDSSQRGRPVYLARFGAQGYAVYPPAVTGDHGWHVISFFDTLFTHKSGLIW